MKSTVIYLQKINLYRCRYIPDEKILLDDKIIFINDDLIITEWVPIRPKKNFAHGRSCVFINKGFKISKLYDSNRKFLFTYCDIVKVIIDKNKNNFFVYDLLVDVVIENDGTIKVLDLDELAEALEKNLIDKKTAIYALNRANALLSEIYSNSFDGLADF